MVELVVGVSITILVIMCVWNAISISKLKKCLKDKSSVLNKTTKNFNKEKAN